MKTLDEWLISLRATQEKNRDIEYLLSRDEATARDREVSAAALRAAAAWFEPQSTDDIEIHHGGVAAVLRRMAERAERGEG